MREEELPSDDGRDGLRRRRRPRAEHPTRVPGGSTFSRVAGGGDPGPVAGGTDVEFLGSAADTDAPDEDLPAPRERSARRRQLVVLAAVVVALGLIAGVVARVATRSSPAAGPATVTVTPSADRNATSRPTQDDPPAHVADPPAVLPALPGLTRARISAAQAECPRLAPSCSTTGETPSAVLRAVRSAYPQAEHLVAVSAIAYSDSSGPRLVYRLLSARAGHSTITVQVRQSRSGDGPVSQRDVEGGAFVFRTQRLTRGLTVEAQVSVPSHRVLAPGSAPTRLILDRGLLDIG